MTNGDRIRQMSNEELAEMLSERLVCHYCVRKNDSNTFCLNSCIEGIKAYLESEEE